MSESCELLYWQPVEGNPPFLATMQVKLMVEDEMREALLTLPEVDFPPEYQPEKLVEFGTGKLEFDEETRPFVMVIYRDSQRKQAFVSHYFGDRQEYERAAVVNGSLSTYSGRCTDFVCGVDVSQGLVASHRSYAHRVLRVQRFLVTGCTEIP